MTQVVRPLQWLAYILLIMHVYLITSKKAELESDEVFADISLMPKPDVSLPSVYPCGMRVVSI
ncbi:hypothetical protein HanHA300_Chr04g0147731 [Helianthus annuus]|nr:hypothetical protein HanHA300_Chr04g0147731 [Helianthus annuus]KAJ0590164.1 hypothetical protein HanIR_Chr04g0194401 [Helianthus annuus]KAJ0598010.1 hypothetical protein HanHA89_Chr04g0161091 [Helianthus annuus]KAJ0758640.1 hypothetical protein HanLR1_Chr04g0152671 [Helianthus annuus]KAJ0762311.1 hypothetical protein HanOQP8_Chr04g0159961 [Helianthus annuus]